MTEHRSGQCWFDEAPYTGRDSSRDGESRDAHVTLQINLAPTDYPFAKHILPHQLRQWSGQVDEVLLTLDLHRSAGRFSHDWEARLPLMRELLSQCHDENGLLRTVDVDYSSTAYDAVSRSFFGGRHIPLKDWRGGPFYAYFFGLHAARHTHVLHFDSDMLFGGGSQFWVREAVQLLRLRSDVLICGPLPGPPTLDGAVRHQGEQPEPWTSRAYRFSDATTRVFLLDRERFTERIGALPVTQPAAHRIDHALKEGNPPYDLPEDIISQAMMNKRLTRVDFLGRDPGMWSLHPLNRSPLFYRLLPEIVRRVEAGDVPVRQRGDYDIGDSLSAWAPRRWMGSWRVRAKLKAV
jgi:hypothetical protein